jgi:hypothetical protein
VLEIATPAAPVAATPPPTSPAPGNRAADAPAPRVPPSASAPSTASPESTGVGNRSPILGLRLLGSEQRSLTVGWIYPGTPPPGSDPWPVRYRAELQQVQRDPAAAPDGGGDLQVDWVPHDNVTWSSQGGDAGGVQSWRVTLRGLPPGTTQIVRIVGLDENGNPFPPSPFLIATTAPPAHPWRWLTLPKILLAALVVCAGLLWRQRRGSAASFPLRT